MVLAIAILYFILFSILAYKNFKTAIGFFIILLPSYFIRFNIGPLPTTLLEWSFGALFLVWLLRYAKNDWTEIKKFYGERYYLCWATVVFLGFSILGVFISSQPIKSLGLWRAYFLEPVLFFILLIARRTQMNKNDLVWFLSLSTISVSAVAILQKITGEPILTSLIKSDLHGRVTSFFTSPNAVGLYLAPVIPFIVYGLNEIKRKKYYLIILMLAILALMFSFSAGALIALGVAFLLTVFLLGYKKLTVVVLLFICLSVLVFAPVRQSLLFQNQSGQNRLILWEYTWNYLNKDLNNFIFGAGIGQFFKKIQKPVNDFKKIEPLIYPHNLFLNFWSEIGLFGTVFFGAIYIMAAIASWKIFEQKKYFGVAILSVLVVFFIHGLVDVPYFKNDLSFLWWILLAIIAI
jgi:O-antigen ligase